MIDPLVAALTQAREEQHLSQRELGRILGRAQSQISRWESGASHPRWSDLVMWADVLGYEIALRVKEAA